MKLFSVLLLCLVILDVNAQATPYYVDFSGGSDANDGLSTSTAFKTIPGTQKADASTYLNTSWGSFTSSARVPDNTTFNIKAGTTETAATGGFVWFNSVSGSFYNQGYTNLVIQVDQSWGTGSTATIDATAMTIPIAVMQIQIDGVTVNGLTITNSQRDAVEVKEKSGSGSQETNSTLLNLTLLANGSIATNDVTGSGEAAISVRHGYGLLISNVVVSGLNSGGSNNWCEGISIGEAHQHVVNALIVNCTCSNLQGDVANNDSGIGFKAFNSICTWSNCVTVGNLKGFDLGEINGDGGVITYKVISCTSSNNYWGLNFNGVGDLGYVGLPINFYAINDLIVSNASEGLHCYAGPFSLYVVNNTLDNNGSSAVGAFNSVNLEITPNGNTDTNLINVFIYNNILQRAFGYQIETGNDSPTNNDNFFIDYNSYKQQAAEHFALWSLSYGPSQATFDYGVNGPGHSSGNWYSWYQNGSSSITAGTGHFQADAHSKGTGSSDTSLPSFGSGYALTAPYPGTNLSSMSWYIPEMGIDRVGRTRINWDTGAFESTKTNLVISVSPNPAVVGVDTVNYALAWQTNGVTDIAPQNGNNTLTVYGINVIGIDSGSTLINGAYSHNQSATIPGGTNVYAVCTYAGLTLTSNIVPLTQKSQTALTLTSSENPSLTIDTVTLTSLVQTSGTTDTAATGSITIFVDGVNTSTATVTSGQVQFMISGLAAGTHTITVTYTGDSAYAAGTGGPLSQVVNNPPPAPGQRGPLIMNGFFKGSIIIPPTNVYWIGTNATGLFASATVHGTVGVPLDGSTQSNFDSNMSLIVTGTSNSISHLETGTFETLGNLRWQLREGQQLIGSGTNATKLQFPAALVSSGAISNAFIIEANTGIFGTNTVSDLTLDCNYQPGVLKATLKGIILRGSSNSIVNVLLTNSASFAGVYAECFGISISPDPVTGIGDGNVIDGCTIPSYLCNSNNDLAAINLNGLQDSIVRNSAVWQPYATNFTYAFNVAGTNIFVIGCYANGVEQVSHNDSLNGGSGITFIGCTFTNVTQLLDFTSGAYVNLNFLTNAVTLNRGLPSHNATAFVLSPPYGVFTPMTFNGFNIIGNSINSTGNTNGVFNLYLATDVVIQANTIFEASTALNNTNLVNCSNVSLINNTNFTGGQWP